MDFSKIPVLALFVITLMVKKIQVAVTHFGLNDLEQESQIARRRIG